VPAFDDLINSLGPRGTSAWATIQGQLSSEGADQPTVVAAQNTFTNAWNSLSTTFGVDADSALTGAAQYTYAASTISGSISMVQGFANDIEQVSTPAGAMNIVNMFTGSMIGLAVAAGAVSAGVGAAIVAAVAVAGDILQDILGRPPGVEICPGISANPPPNWVVHCTPVWGTSYSPGQNGWRKFPSTPEWFAVNGSATLMDGWTGDANTLPIHHANLRPIDVLFPEYAVVDYLIDLQSLALTGFHGAFVAAWKANKEFALNGQKVPTDATVLQHCILVWNRAHDNSSTTQLSSSTSGYEGSLVSSAIAVASSALQAANYISGQSFIIHTGPIRTFSHIVPLTLHHLPVPATAAPAPPSAVKTAVGVTAAAAGTLALAAVAISFAKGKAWDWAFSQAWAEIKDVFAAGGPHKFLTEKPIRVRARRSGKVRP
jgi:hypothetical protein